MDEAHEEKSRFQNAGQIFNKGSEQMEVYIIEAYYCNGESEVKDVFSTFEKAKSTL